MREHLTPLQRCAHASAKLDDGVRNEAIRFGRADVMRWLIVTKQAPIDHRVDLRTHVMEAELQEATAIVALLRELGARATRCPFCASERIRLRWAIPPDGGIYGWFCDACGRNC